MLLKSLLLGQACWWTRNNKCVRSCRRTCLHNCQGQRGNNSKHNAKHIWCYFYIILANRGTIPNTCRSIECMVLAQYLYRWASSQWMLSSISCKLHSLMLGWPISPGNFFLNLPGWGQNLWTPASEEAC